MSEDSREDPSNANVGSAVVVEKEELKDKEGKVVDEIQSLSRIGISGDDDATASEHSTPPRSVKSTEIVDASPSSKSNVRPTRRSPRIAARSAPAGVVGSSAGPSPKSVLRVPIFARSVEKGKSTRKHSVAPEALSGKDTPKSDFDTGRRRKQGDTDEANVDAVARRDEDARDGDKKAPKRQVEEKKTGKDPDKRRRECDDKPKQETEERDQEEGNNLGVEESMVAPERLLEEEKTGKGSDKRLGKGDDRQKQETEEMEGVDDLGVEKDIGAPERLVEEGKAEKDPREIQEMGGEEKGAVGDEDDMGGDEEVGEHDDSTDGGETELEEEEDYEDATDVEDAEVEMEEEERRTVGGGERTGERKGLQDVEREAREDVISGDDYIDGGEDDTARERATKRRKNREEDEEEEEEDEDKEEEEEEDEEEEEEDEDKEEEEEEEEEDEVDIDAMIKLASSAVKGQISEPIEGASGAGIAGEKRLAAGGDGKMRPRKVRRGGAIMSLDSGLSSSKGLLNAETKKKRESLSAFVSPKAVDGKVANLYAGSDLYSGRDRATLLKKTKTPKDETAGKGWFNMEQAEMTPELKRDLQVIRMRNYLDPKRFYKSSDKVSKFVQVGTVKEGPGEFFSSRMTNKERKKTLVDELLVADDNFRTYAKSKYKSIQEKNRAGGKAHYKKLSRKRMKGPKWKL